MNFIDSHAHTNDPAFDADRQEVIERAFASGLSHIIEIACEQNEWQSAIELCAKYPGKIYAVCGMHPIMAKEWKEEDKAELKKYLALPPVRALGEIGLDY
ncbi:MAG: TatD family hydrolase, partial [Elusimicrobiota bacterium]|nr:TatD family hydrolase [Elusimicrobiota bacterium]